MRVRHRRRAWLASARDLNPPPGPIRPTNRIQLNAQAITLPLTIDQPGSYVLTSSLTGAVGQHGIIITSDDVTLDLNGFALIGAPGSLDGIHVPENVNNLAVRNGVVRSWRGDGVDAVNARHSDLANLRALGNLGTGLKIGDFSTVRNCGGPNGANGISTGDSCIITNCTANASTFSGIVTGSNNQVTGCTAVLNGGNGITVGDGSGVMNCTAAENFSDGISAGLGCNVMGCTALGNVLGGIRTGGHSTVVNCTATGNGDDGIATGQGSTIRGCSSSNNETGIDANVRSTVIACTTNGNVFRGISNSGGSVAQCTSTFNGTFGMTCGVALANTAVGNDPDIGAGCINAHNDCNTCDDP